MTGIDKTRDLIGIVCLLAIIAGCSEEFDNTYTITGEYFLTKFDNRTRVNEEKRTTSATVIVSTTKISDEGETETVDIASGIFVDNQVRLEGEIDKPTTVLISVHDGEEEVSTTSALVAPGEEVAFAYERFVGLGSDSLTVDLLGVARRSEDSSKKFTITGDFRDFGESLHLGRVFVQWKKHPDDELKARVRPSVKIKDQTFLLEADIEEPTVAQVVVYLLSNKPFISVIDVVLEPNAEIQITGSESGDRLIATSNRGRHFELINSWSQREDYIKKSLAYESAFTKFQTEVKGARLSKAVQFPPTEGKVFEFLEDRKAKSFIEPIELIDSDAGNEIAQTDRFEAPEPGLQPVDECEHLVPDLVQLADDELAVTEGVPEHQLLDQELSRMRESALQDLARKSKDPVNTLLALELGAFHSNSSNSHEAFTIFDKLDSLLEAELAARRVSPLREGLQHAIDKKKNNKQLVLGQRVPPIKLPTLLGNEISLDDILQKSEYVLVEFWASWCDPCVSRFSDLKQLYTRYKDEGFEIVGISIDSTIEDWESSSEEHQLPWTNLGEIEGWDGSIVNSYGVVSMPHRYLVDSNGCVLKKDVTAYELKEYLASQFDTVEQ